MIPILWGDPGIKALLEAPPSCCGVFQRVRAAPWISPTGMCQQGNPECASGNENSPNLGQLLSHPLGCPAGIPRAAPEEPLGCSCLDPAVPWDKSQRNRVGLKEFPSSAAASSPRNFGRGTSVLWDLGSAPFSHPKAGLGLGGDISKLLLFPGMHKVLLPTQGRAEGILIPAAMTRSDQGCPIQP